MLPFLTGSAHADPPPTNGALDTVTVEAARERERLEHRISSFVSSITIPFRDESLARWQSAICPLVAGLPPEEGEFVFDRVSRVASDAGVPLAPEKCTPNFLVVATSDPEALLQKWWGRSARLFNEDRGTAGMQRFIHSDQSVRVWYNACSVSPGGAKTFKIKGDPSCNTGAIGSRLSFEAVRVIYSVVVVVDLGHIEGLNVGQLADYIAMIGLAQIRKNPDLGGAPTILHLFAETDAPKPQGLSIWDQTFLKSLYRTDPAKITQMSEIKFRMGRDLVP